MDPKTGLTATHPTAAVDTHGTPTLDGFSSRCPTTITAAPSVRTLRVAAFGARGHEGHVQPVDAHHEHGPILAASRAATEPVVGAAGGATRGYFGSVVAAAPRLYESSLGATRGYFGSFGGATHGCASRGGYYGGLLRVRT